MGGAPVRGYKSLETDLIAQDLGQRVLVAAGIDPVDAVVRAHDRRDAVVDGRIKRRHVNFMQRLVVYPHILRFGVVGYEMFHLGHNMLRLNASYFSRGDLASKEGIFAEGVITTSELQVPVDVDKRLQGHIDSQSAGFAANHQPIFLGRSAAEGSGDSHGGCFALRRMPGEYSRWSIGKAQPWDPEPRNS